MTYRKLKEDLLKEGRIKKCPIDYRTTTNLMKRAYTDLKTAKRNLDVNGDGVKKFGTWF